MLLFPVAYQRMCLRLERYFKSVEEVDMPPDAPPGWRQYASLLSNESSTVTPKSVDGSRGEKSMMSRSKVLNNSSKKLDIENHQTPGRTDMLASRNAVPQRKFPDLQVEGKTAAGSDETNSFKYHPEDKTAFTSIHSLEMEQRDKELPLTKFSSKDRKRSMSNSLENRNQTTQVKRVKTTVHSHGEGVSVTDQVALNQDQCIRKDPCNASKIEAQKQNQNDLGLCNIAPTPSSSILLNCFSAQPHILENFKGKLIEQRVGISKLLPKSIIRLLLNEHNSQTVKVESKLQTIMNIQHIVHWECQKQCEEPTSTNFWEMCKFNMCFVPPENCPEALFATESQFQEYSQLLENMKQRKIRLYQLSNKLQKHQKLKSLIDRLSNAVQDSLNNTNMSRKSGTLQYALRVKADLEELMKD